MRLTKTVSERVETVDVPLTEEHTEIERVAINRIVTAAPEVRVEGDVLIVPVLEEVLVTEKRLMLREELHIRKRAVITRNPQQVTLRQEQVTVEQPSRGTAGTAGTAEHSTGSSSSSRLQPALDSKKDDMAGTTLVGIFDETSQAEDAAREIERLGVPEANVTVARSDYQRSSYTTGRSTTSQEGGGIGGFFRNLFGSDVDDDDRGIYAEAVRRGSVVVTAQVDEPLVDRAAEVLNSYGAVDVDRRASQYRSSGYSGFDETASPYSSDQARSELETYRSQSYGSSTQTSSSQGDVALPVIQEELQVGKRAVQRGGVRVYTRMTEQPVEETVTLREERVHVERRPVDRAVTDADYAQIKDGVLEVTETSEEAVVAKQARVVEEIVVGKDVVDRQETIRDTVRRTDVDVENVETETSTRRDQVTTGRQGLRDDKMGV